MANIFTLAHDSWTYQDISWSAPVGQTKGHLQILQDTKRTDLGTSDEQMDAYSNSLKYLNDILRQHEAHKMQLCNDCKCKCRSERVFPNYWTLCMRRKIVHTSMAVSNLYNECLPVWNSTIAFTMSIGVISIFWCLPEFSTNIKTLSGDFFFSGFLHTRGSLQLVQLGFHLHNQQKLSGFQSIWKLWKVFLKSQQYYQSVLWSLKSIFKS